MGVGMQFGLVSGMIVIVGSVLARMYMVMHVGIRFVRMLMQVLMQVLMGMDMLMFVLVGLPGVRMFVCMRMLVIMCVQVLVLMCAFHSASFRLFNFD